MTRVLRYCTLGLLSLCASACTTMVPPSVPTGAASGAYDGQLPPLESVGRPAGSARDPAAVLSEGPGAYIFSHDPRELADEVRRVCDAAQTTGRRKLLRSLVAELYFSGVHPAAATEALLSVECATPAEVVEEMVAHGGEASLEPVTSRARALEGVRAHGAIETAAALGLARYAGLAEAGSGSAAGESSAYGMLYFPSVGESAKLVTAVALNRLYEEAVPGYGVYTFVLLGRGLSHPTGTDAARYAELFRMIETYVATMDRQTGEPRSDSHVFLVPVNPGMLGAPLIDQTAPDLSDVMRRRLAQVARRAAQGQLAVRLDRGSGPFLVATLRPTLIPESSTSPWMIADLSGLGPEYLYGIVDAFDRVIPSEDVGRPESLERIRDRLLRLQGRPGSGSGSVESGSAAWIFMLGDFGARIARSGTAVS